MSNASIKFHDNIGGVKSPEARRKTEGAIYVSLTAKPGIGTYGALDLDEAKAAHNQLGQAIEAAEKRIEGASKPQEPEDGAVVKFRGRVPAYRGWPDEKWRFTTMDRDFTWDEMLAFVGHGDFEVLYPKPEEDWS